MKLRVATRKGLFTLRPSRVGWEIEAVAFLGVPGIHSVMADGRHLMVGVSCGGVWASDDGGETWEARTKGMYAAYLPPELKDEASVQDPHRVARCGAAPEVLWTQHHNGAFRS